MTLTGAQALGHLPQSLRDELLDEYHKVTHNYVRRHWEATELDGGRFCEIVYTILRGHVDNSYPISASKPQNFPQACSALAQAATFPKSVRIGIPRVLAALYDIRNNRGVGHVGGDVDANHMDAAFVLHSVQWVMAELVRVFHQTDVNTATRIVSKLVTRVDPLVWCVGDRRRVLNGRMSLADRTLLLLHTTGNGISDKELAKDLKQSRLSNYKRVLKQLDTDLMVEYDEQSGHVEISPIGEKHVEEVILPTVE
jgi:hypothetical protein